MPGIGLGLHDALVLLVLLVAEDGLQLRHRGVFDLLMVLMRALHLGVLLALLLHRRHEIGTFLSEDLLELRLLRIGQCQLLGKRSHPRLRVRRTGRRRLRQHDGITNGAHDQHTNCCKSFFHVSKAPGH